MIGPPTPPALARLGAERTRWDPGHTEIRWQVPNDKRFGNTAGTVHGGYLCVIADALLGSSLSSLAGPDQRSVNPDFHAEFLTPLPLGATLIGEGRVSRQGNTVSFLEATLRREDDGEPLLIAMSLGVTRPRASAARRASPLPETASEPRVTPPVRAPDGSLLPACSATSEPASGVSKTASPRSSGRSATIASTTGPAGCRAATSPSSPTPRWALPSSRQPATRARCRPLRWGSTSTGRLAPARRCSPAPPSIAAGAASGSCAAQSTRTEGRSPRLARPA